MTRDGIRSLDDVLARCRVDDLTGCWRWALAISTPRGRPTPYAHIPPGVFGNDRALTMSAARAAWLLSGRKAAPDQVVWRSACTLPDCVNPAHCSVGTKGQMHAGIAATGRNRGKPQRAAVNFAARMAMVTPVEKVRAAEALFAAGVLQKDVRERLGMSQKTAAAIRKGLHPHSAGRQHLVRGASVFALAANVDRMEQAA